MHRFIGWHRWLMVIFGLPIATILSTFIISQTQIGQLMPADMPFQPTLWTALQLSLASGLIWLVCRPPSPKRNWAIIGKSIIEGIVFCGITLVIFRWFLLLIDLNWNITTDSMVALAGLALPLAWWSMAEERVLRGELHTLLGTKPPLLRDVIMLGIGWCVQLSLVSGFNLFVALVLLLCEGLSVITWSGQANFERTWSRRWVWRWMFVVFAGVSATGFVTATPAPLIVMADDPFVLAMLVTAPLTTWIIYAILQNYATE
jgi:hypothetical protein